MDQSPVVRGKMIKKLPMQNGKGSYVMMMRITMDYRRRKRRNIDKDKKKRRRRKGSIVVERLK